MGCVDTTRYAPNTQPERMSSMESSKHTPGPWDVYDDSPSEDYRKGTCILTLADSREYEGGDRVATVERFTDSALIAAAPDMYEALRLMVWRYEDTENMDDEDYPELAAARAALAKAEGR